MKDTKISLSMTTMNGGNAETSNGFRHKHDHGEEESNRKNGLEELKNDELNNKTTEELVGGCCVCSDDQGFPNNALVYCDGKDCAVACHTACYGIVSIPDGDWYCGRCEAGETRAPCRLCPMKEGAMKRTSDGGWAHVVCALYIPEVSFGDDTTMEPIILSEIPASRYGQSCSICMKNGRSNIEIASGACCGCTVKNCSQVFHVTCAQTAGFLCEDVRKNNCQYPIFCEQHRPKLSKFIRQIPAFHYTTHSSMSPNKISSRPSFSKEKESPSQLSDFVAAAAAEAAASVPTSSDETNNNNNNSSFSSSITNTSEEQQMPVSRACYGEETLPRKSSSSTTTNASQSSTSISPIVPKSHSRSSSSSSNSSSKKKTKPNDDNSNSSIAHVRSLTDLSQFVELNKEERNFLPPPNPPPPRILSEVETKADLSATDTSGELVIDTSYPNLEHQSSITSIEEKPLASRCAVALTLENKSKIKHRRLTDVSSASSKTSSLKKTFMTRIKDDDDDDEEYQANKKRKLTVKLNKDGQPRKKRQLSTNSVDSGKGSGRRLSKKLTAIHSQQQQQSINGLKRLPMKTSSTNNMKQQTIDNNSITMRTSTDQIEHDNDDEKKTISRSTIFYPCDHFGNQVNADVFQQSNVNHLEHLPPTDCLGETSRSRIPSSTTLPRIDFYPRRPLHDDPVPLSTSSVLTEQQQQSRPFPPQSLEEFLEQEWERSSDFLLQQTMPHDVSSLLSCLYQFKSENAALQKKFDELKHRRDCLRVTNANLRRRLSEVLPATNETTTIPPSAPLVSQISPPAPPAPPPPPLPTLLAVPSSPRKEQQQLKQQKLLAELELQQQLQHQKTISPSRRCSSTTTTTNNNHQHHSDSCQHQLSKKNKTSRPINTNTSTHSSILESQLRQATKKSISNSTKKVIQSAAAAAPQYLSSSSEMELISHHHQPPTSVNVTGGSSASSSPYEQVDATATAAAAAAAYALAAAKNGPTAAQSAGLSIELLTQILAASNSLGSQLFAPTWNISNFGYANFPGANPMPVADESLLRSYTTSIHPPLEQQPSAKSQQQP